MKTRLCPPYTHPQAARLAAAALTDTLEAVMRTPAAARTLVLDGPVGPWVPAGIAVCRQRGVGLDARLAATFDDAYRRVPAPLLLIGMDTPQVTEILLTSAAQALSASGVDAVLGMAEDGGWWALGLRQPDRRLLLGVPMSTSYTGAAQRRRLAELGLSVHMLPTLLDVDTAPDAQRVAAATPGSRFAGAVESASMELAS